MKEEKNLLKLTPDKDCHKTYLALFDNAEKFINEHAEDAAKRKNYGLATSNLIHSTEELVKGLLFYIQSLKVNIRNVPGIQIFFTDHIIRHQLVIYINIMFATIKPLMNLLYKMRDELHNPDKTPNYTPEERAFLSKDDKRMKVMFKDLPNMLDWWDEAMEKRNQGLYVDIDSTKGLATPMQVTEEEYTQAYNLTQHFKSELKEITAYFDKRTPEEMEELLTLVKKENFFAKMLTQIIEARKEQRKNTNKFMRMFASKTV